MRQLQSVQRLGYSILRNIIAQKHVTIASQERRLICAPYSTKVSPVLSAWPQVEHEGDFGEGTVAVDLVQNGGDVAVSQANKQQYVDLYVEHLLLKSVEKQRKAFCRGFHKVRICLPALPINALQDCFPCYESCVLMS